MVTTNKNNDKKASRITEGMTPEDYILYKLSKLSKADKKLAKDMATALGEWTSPKEVAKYLSKSVTTIYDRIYSQEILAKKFGNKYLVYSKSLILLLDDIDN